ncbi:putative signal transducing protein [Rhodovibrionaceae bacterium A322]
MKELVRSNDPVRLSWLQALLKDAGIVHFLLDEHTSVLEGSLVAIPRRLVVDSDDFEAAKILLEAAGEELSEKESFF